MKTLRSFFFAFGQSGWVVLGLIGASLLAYGLFSLAPAGVSHYATTNDVGLVLANALVYTLAVGIVLLPLIWRKRWSRDVAELLGVAKRLTFSGVGLAVMGWIFYFVASLLVAIAINNIPGFNAEQEQDVGFKDLSLVYEYVAAFIGLVILPPLAEELLFRGYLFGQLRSRFGFVVSAVVTSAVFGFVHLQWNVGVDVFILSLVLCYLRENTGSIWAGMIVHGLKNGLAYFVLFIAPLMHFNLLQ